MAVKNGIAQHLVAVACMGFAGAGLCEEKLQTMREVTVTGTREERPVAETPATIDVVRGETIREMRPTHPSQVMGQVPGVWVNVTGGEGHITAIRQPLTTSPVYLYLEDGIPTRSTGFFNHNALYEINVPQSGGIEVSKGPGTALYGSDAIGGVINVLTRTPPTRGEFELSGEAGQFGWKRALLSAGNAEGNDAWRGDANLTRTDGWRDRTGYERQSATLRWDRALGSDALLKTVASFSGIDQQTAGSSTVSKDDYRNNPTRNYAPISFRKVAAFRLSAAYERESGGSLLSITPYLRRDDMDLLANWSLGYDPTVYNTQNDSLGLMLKYRRDFAPLRARLIVGLDIDNSPGSRSENSIVTTGSGSGFTRVYTSYASGGRIYDYDVTYRGVSPYAHGEISPGERLRLSAGLRYDSMRYSYDNRLAEAAIAALTSVGTKWYGHAADATTSYGHWSPKLGATYAASERLNGFVAYNHAFRAPSEGQLFRPPPGSSAVAAQEAAAAALALQPVKADNFELGLRGKAGAGMNYEISLYRLSKRDDILSFKDPATNATRAVNAGRTLHRGIEFGLGAGLARAWRLDASLSYARHSYEQWVVPGTADFSGKEMETAPRVIANTRLSYAPSPNLGRLQVEWIRLGSYWLDQANSARYAGHDVFSLRGSLPFGKDLELFGSITNLFDRRYAESAALSSGNEVFAPGMPRAAYLGLQAKW